MALDSMIVKLDNGLLVLKINSVVLLSFTVRQVDGMMILYCNKCRLNCCTHHFFSVYNIFLEIFFYRFKRWQISYSEYWGICKHIIYGVNHFPHTAQKLVKRVWTIPSNTVREFSFANRTLFWFNQKHEYCGKLVYSFWLTFMLFII